jgi:hypothetical protein
MQSSRQLRAATIGVIQMWPTRSRRVTSPQTQKPIASIERGD